MQKDTVASLRLDNVLSSAFSLSRAKAAEAIRTGLVFVNSAPAEKTDLQVMEVCLECGYNNLGNFLREFRKYTGTTPLQYRKQVDMTESK